ncbi:MAG: winged helix-turn-helix domain-containing protein [Nitrososphaerales archaeon]
MAQNNTSKRDRLNILLEILEMANVPIKKTHILYRANINFNQLTTYLNLLLRLEMIEQTKEPFVGYKITGKGRQMLDLFQLNTFDKVIPNIV